MRARLVATLAFAAAGLAPGIAVAQPAKPFLKRDPPVPAERSGKVEVVEFFWYECPHCYSLEPLVEGWLKKLPKDIEFRRVPAMFSQQWTLSERVYYTLEATGELDRLHKPLFDASHKSGLKVTIPSLRGIRAWPR